MLEIRSTPFALSIAASLMLSASLSAVHLLGFTLVMSSAFAGHLRMLGLVFRDRPVTEVTTPAARGIAISRSV